MKNELLLLRPIISVYVPTTPGDQVILLALYIAVIKVNIMVVMGPLWASLKLQNSQVTDVLIIANNIDIRIDINTYRRHGFVHQICVHTT